MTNDTDVLPETPDGWTGPRDHLEAGERWHTGGGIELREAVHPDLGLHIVWNPEHDPIEVGIERVEKGEDYGVWHPVEKLEQTEYDSDASALEALPDLCERAERKYSND